MKRNWLIVLLAALASAQDLQQALKRGEEVFKTSCATGYCHGQNGTAGGAPRLAARGFDQAVITNIVTRGVPSTAMPAFAGTLSRPDLIAVVAYVATLNGIANPNLNPGPQRGGPVGPAEPPLPPEAARGRDLFYDAVRGFARCATCQEVHGMGMPVATPIQTVPADVAALRALATPAVSTATMDGESMPALVLSQTRQRVLFYDLTVAPPVLRTVDPATVKIAQGSGWSHSSAIGSYSDAEMSSILDFLHAVVKR